jgi:hypothetical protein
MAADRKERKENMITRTGSIYTTIMASVLACVISFGTLLDAMAADSSISTEINSAYVYRGITYNDGLVIQPSLDITSGFVGFNVWANYDLGNYNGLLQSHRFSEVDLTAYVFTTLNGFDLSLSISEYLYPNVTLNDKALPGNREIIAAAKHSIIGPLSAELKFQYEVKEIKDYYARFTLACDLPEPVKDLKSALSMSIAYVGDDTAVLSSGGEEGGFHEYNIKLSATYALSGKTSIGATVAYTDTMDKDVLPDCDVNCYGGLVLKQTL